MDGKSTYGAGTTLPEQRSYIDGAYASNQELAELETLDTGKPISETSVVDIATGADVIEYFAGYKQSGLGRENGLQAVEHYTQVKTVYVNLGDVPPSF